MICYSFISWAQIQNEVNEVLEKKNFPEFETFTLNLKKNDNRRRCYWENIRQVTPSYREGTFIFEESFPKPNKPNNFSVYRYRVILITTDTDIIFYELSKIVHKKNAGYWDEDYELLHSFKNEFEYQTFKEEFQSLFLTEINESELFTSEFVYGRSCSIAGLAPKGRVLITKLIENKDKVEIIKWLQSTITEKQIYALEALYELKNCGITLTQAEYKMIKFVINKKGSMSVCSGCIYSKESISNVTEEFNFDY